jgi:hypothetical protein
MSDYAKERSKMSEMVVGQRTPYLADDFKVGDLVEVTHTTKGKVVETYSSKQEIRVKMNDTPHVTRTIPVSTISGVRMVDEEPRNWPPRVVLKVDSGKIPQPLGWFSLEAAAKQWPEKAVATKWENRGNKEAKARDYQLLYRPI